MTADEAATFNEMFSMIFESQERNAAAFSAGRLSDTTQRTSVFGRTSVDRTSQPMTKLFRSVRRHTKRVNWTTKSDELLDRLKEDVDMCRTDQELLAWAMAKIFTPELHSNAIKPKASKSTSTAASQSSTATNEHATDQNAQAEEVTAVDADFVANLPSVYPHILAHLMHTFRERHNDPHLALSLFTYARHLSVPSFVYGCTTPVYNELIATRWRCFADLRGVYDALEEMRANGIATDTKTRAITESIRREVGGRNVWVEETSVGGTEVWDMLSRMDELTAVRPRRIGSVDESSDFGSRKDKGAPRAERRWKAHHESWQNRALDGNDTKDNWQFGVWNSAKDKESPRRWAT